jgi:hypothetical protein
VLRAKSRARATRIEVCETGEKPEDFRDFRRAAVCKNYNDRAREKVDEMTKRE